MHQDFERLDDAAELLRQARRVVVFTGAGISAESGIPTFRDKGGVWDRFPPEEYATPHGLLMKSRTEPERAAAFAYGLLQPIAAAEPNAGHRAIAALQDHCDVSVVTQNIDGLHQDAGSKIVWEVHGSTFEIVSASGRHMWRVSRDEVQEIVAELETMLAGEFDAMKAFAAIGRMIGAKDGEFYRPSIVLFGEAMAEPDWSEAVDAAGVCDCMLVVGTSGLVYPAAMLPEMAKSAGASIIAVGPEEGIADVWLTGAAGVVLPALLRAAYSTPD